MVTGVWARTVLLSFLHLTSRWRSFKRNTHTRLAHCIFFSLSNQIIINLIWSQTVILNRADMYVPGLHSGHTELPHCSFYLTASENLSYNLKPNLCSSYTNSSPFLAPVCSHILSLSAEPYAWESCAVLHHHPFSLVPKHLHYPVSKQNGHPGWQNPDLWPAEALSQLCR